MQPSDFISAASLTLSIALGFFYFKDRALARFSISNSYSSELLSWHYDVVKLLCKMNHSNKNSSDESYRDDLASLSALIEQGRFFFPNIDKSDGHGNGKPAAYRGYRNLSLEFLVSSYDLLASSNPQALENEINELQRHFTSIVFEVVNPKDRLQQIRDLTDKYFVKDYSAEDFVENGTKTPKEVIFEIGDI